MAETHTITPEEIAREAAEALVNVKATEAGLAEYGRAVFIGTEDAYHYRSHEEAVRDVAKFREQIAAAVLAAVERALRTVPVPGGLSAERVAEINGWVRVPPKDGRPVLPLLSDAESVSEAIRRLTRALQDMNADNAHLRRALHDCGQDGSANQWAAGWRAAAQAYEARVARLEKALAVIADLPTAAGDDAIGIANDALHPG